MEEKKKDSIYELDGTVPLKRALPSGVQHILTVFLGNVSPLIIVCGMLEMNDVLKMILIQNVMSVVDIATLFQLYPFWRIGSGLPIVMGTSSGFIGIAKVIGTTFGYGALMGASPIGGIFETVMGYFIKPLCELFPPVVTNLVIVSVGLSLLSVGINYFGEGNGAADFGSTNHLLVGIFVTIVILTAKQFKGAIDNVSIPIGIVAGYILATILGMADFTQVSSTNWLALPAFMSVVFEFNSQAIIAMGVMFVATTMGAVGDVSGVADDGLNREATDKELQGGVMADDLGSALGVILGVLPGTSFLQNIGLVAVAEVVNRFVIMIGAVFLVLYGFCPKLSALSSVVSQFALGGVAVIMFATTLINGIQSLAREPPDEHSGLTVALTIGLGVGIGDTPAILAQPPSWVGNIFAQNGVIMIFVITTVLNLILPRKKNEEE